MPRKTYDRKAPSAEFGNCITNEENARKTIMQQNVEKNKVFEAKNKYLVIKLEPHGVKYKRIKEGDKIPKGATIHYGNI